MRTNIRVQRRGYSLTVVLLFLVLLLGLWATVYRTTASFLRVETARVKRDDLDTGMLSALGQSLMHLEQNPPQPGTTVPPPSLPITVPPATSQNFVATFSPAALPNGWTVTVRPFP